MRINGKGPFNFLVDTGAPALYVATETARKIGLEPARNEFWTPVDRLDFEGGARLTDVKARVEDPFQLVGMNALGLPGASIDGILGFTILARFRLELDPTRDRMTWTRLDYEPAEPPVPRRAGEPASGPRPEIQAMNLLGPLAKVAGAGHRGQAARGRAPPARLPRPRAGRGGGRGPRGRASWPARPRRGPGSGRATAWSASATARSTSLKAAREAVAEVRPGDRVALVVRRGAGTGPRT